MGWTVYGGLDWASASASPPEIATKLLPSGRSLGDSF